MEIGNNLYRVKSNLHVNKNLIISYETVVARIESDKIVKLGRFSRTTGKHIVQIASMLGIPVVEPDSKKTIHYDKYEYGVKINLEGSISPKTTSIIFDMIKSGVPYTVAVASISREVRKRDWDLLDKSGVTEDMKSGGSMLRRFGII